MNKPTLFILFCIILTSFVCAAPVVTTRIISDTPTLNNTNSIFNISLTGNGECNGGNTTWWNSSDTTRRQILGLDFNTNVTSGNFFDYTQNNNNATCSGSTCPIYNASCGVDGSGCYEFYSPNYFAVDLDVRGYNEISFGGWIKTTFGYDRTMISWRSNALAIRITGTQFFCGFTNSTTLSPSAGVYGISLKQNNTWYHIMCTYNGSVAKIYENGIFINNVSETVRGPINYSSYSSPAGGFWINKQKGGSEFTNNATIENLKIYNYALTPAQISEEYNATIQKRSPRLLAEQTTTGDIWTANAVCSNTTAYSSVSRQSVNIWYQDIPKVSWNAQDPADINTTNIIVKGLNVSYSITDSDGLNLADQTLWYKVNNTFMDGLIFVNGTLQTGWTNETSNKYNLSNLFYFQMKDNDIIPGVYNLEEDAIENTVHSFVSLTNPSEYLAVEVLNVSADINYSFVEYMANGTSSATQKIYYCNQNYDFSSKPDISASCVIICTGAANAAWNHCHTNQSCHNSCPISINSGLIGTVPVTEKSYFMLQGLSTGSENVYYVANQSRQGAARLSITSGNTWTNQTYTPDLHYHQVRTSSFLSYYACGKDVIGNTNCTTTDIKTDHYELGDLPPTQPIVLSPTNKTYYSNINITYLAAISPNGYTIASYNISLYNTDHTFNQTIIANNYPNTYYSYNVTNVTTGYYMIHVEACDVNGRCSTAMSEIFYIDRTSLAIQNYYISDVTPYTFTVNIDLTKAADAYAYVYNNHLNPTVFRFYENSSSILKIFIYGLYNNTNYWVEVNGTDNTFQNYTTGLLNVTTAQNQEVDSMFFTLGLILLPILIGFLLIYSSTTLNEEHGILKMFLFILGFATPIIAYQYSMELISTQATLSLMLDSTGQHSSIFSWIFYIVLIYFILFSAIMLIRFLAERKKEKLEYD